MKLTAEDLKGLRHKTSTYLKDETGTFKFGCLVEGVILAMMLLGIVLMVQWKFPLMLIGTFLALVAGIAATLLGALLLSEWERLNKIRNLLGRVDSTLQKKGITV